MTEYPILAIDFGKKHFGTAISDSKGIIASPLEVISITEKRGIEYVLERISDICTEYKIKTILLGIPQVFTEAHSKTPKAIMKFKEKLEKTLDLPIILYDESFSTTSAQNMLTSSGSNTKSSRGKIDKVSAAVFLQEFLNSSKN
ncbi:MAG: hypothetical protein UR73_C0034G0002 [candidate division WS6 bacterium GW2011_GWF1_35_23]|uniref:Putative pre-16S rRNA nuclease n=1 Tax=candidate division WS6 bacterium GW2011_GWF1_35_23 TaxID=1619097 RepID=A0A0G0EJP6_9BACT|nr:MAG: hypothetical protein UR73_C0034G0002 [candidate division WS6 bacterium GW2011_GWF1_35_23]